MNVPNRNSTSFFTLPGLLGMLWRRRFILAAVFVTVLGGAVLLALKQPVRYKAEMKLLVRRDRVAAPISLGRGEAAVVSPAVSAEDVAMEVEILRSRDILEMAAAMQNAGAMDQPSTVRDRERIERAVRELEKDLEIAPVGRTQLISVKYSSPEPAKAADTLNMLADLYLNKHASLLRNRNASVILRAEAERYNKEVSDAQAALTAFRYRGEVTLLTDQKQSALRRLAELEAAVQETDAQIRDTENRAGVLRSQRAALPKVVQTSTRSAKATALIERLKGQLLDLQQKRAELLTRYQADYELVQNVDQQIQATRAALEQEQTPEVIEQTRSVNPLREATEAELYRTESGIAGWKARRSALAAEIANYRQRLRHLDSVTAEHDNLERRLKLAEENLVFYERKREEARANDALDKHGILNVSVADRAVPPALPAEGHRKLILALGFLGALFTAFGAALLADSVSPSTAGPGGYWMSERTEGPSSGDPAWDSREELQLRWQPPSENSEREPKSFSTATRPQPARGWTRERMDTELEGLTPGESLVIR